MNKVQLLGRLTKDVDVRTTSTGKTMAQFTLAVEMGKDAEGNKKSVFIPCSAWEKKAEALGKYVVKGQRLLITNGTLQVRAYTDNSGVQKIFTFVEVKEFEFIENRSTWPEETGAQPQTGEQLEAAAKQQAGGALSAAVAQVDRGLQTAQPRGKSALSSMGTVFEDVDINF